MCLCEHRCSCCGQRTGSAIVLGGVVYLSFLTWVSHGDLGCHLIQLAGWRASQTHTPLYPDFTLNIPLKFLDDKYFCVFVYMSLYVWVHIP